MEGLFFAAAMLYASSGLPASSLMFLFRTPLEPERAGIIAMQSVIIFIWNVTPKGYVPLGFGQLESPCQ